MNQPERFIISSKDVMVITGLSLRSAQKLLQKIRAQHNIIQHHYVSVEQFCAYMHLNEEKVKRGLR